MAPLRTGSYAIQTASVLALAASSSAALLQRSWIPWGVACAAIALLTAWWLWKEGERLADEYAHRETEGRIYSAHDRLVWGDKKPLIRDLAIPMFFASFGILWLAYEAAIRPYQRSTGLFGLLFDSIHATLGAPGLVVFWTTAWAWLMSHSLGVAIGSRWREKSG